jgi:phosphoglycolate phosphatase
LGHLCVTAEDLKPLFGKVMTEIADVILATIPENERYALMDRCMATENQYLHDHSCDIGYPGIRETIAKLSKKYRLFIVSNSQCGYPELCIEKLGLTDYITGHLCFGDTGTEKGRTIRRLMETYNIQNAAYVGDTQGDYEATVQAGIPFVFAAYGFGQPEHWDVKIEKFEELLNI